MAITPYDPRSGNTPDAKPLDIAGMRYQAQAPKAKSAPIPQPAYNPQYGNPLNLATPSTIQSGFVGTVEPTNNVATLTPEQYPTKVIIDRYGNKVEVYTSGPLAGRSKTTGELVIQANDNVSPEAAANSGDGPPKPVTLSFQQAQDKILSDTLTSYGMQGIAAVIARIRAENPEISSEDLTFLLKNDSRYNAEYTKRFAGNAKLKAAGLPTLDDATYLKTENEYKKIFTSYGATALANNDYYATLIGNRMDAVDVTGRLNLAYDRLQATPNVKDAFKRFYGAVTDGDILSAMLDPTTQIPQLEQKVKAAEIGGAALAQKLDTSLARATELAAMGVTGAQAQTAYQTIGMKLPTGKFLSEISPEEGIRYTQTTAENIAFKKSAADKLAEDLLSQKEIGRFGGSAGRFASKDRAAGLI